MTILFRPALTSDLDDLVKLEELSFKYDRLSRRRLRHWIKASNGALIIAVEKQQLLGYGLALLHSGTNLARLYSLAVKPGAQGKGIGKALVNELENAATKTGRLFMRLEVAKHNKSAIHLYQQLGYHVFGEYTDYYEDHSDAVRMQKRIRYPENKNVFNDIPWYRQTTEFTCGPAALLMAMASINKNICPSQTLELDIWREATTIFMTSGHGGCHPLGLALSAAKRGFFTKVFINTDKPLFIDGVRSKHKKQIMTLVDQQFREKIQQENIELAEYDLSQEHLIQLLEEGFAVIIMISTYRLDGRKVPHWVTVTNIDELCLYVHDPDPDIQYQDALDCQHIPIARNDFAKMSSFGNNRLRTAIAIKTCL